MIGVVPNTRYRDLRDARLSAYFPLQQSFFPFVPLTIAIRTAAAPSQAIVQVRRAIASVAPGVVLASAAPFDTYLNIPLAQPRLNTVLLVVFGSTAVVLAGIGLFGTMMTMVRLRTREMGVRMALGASTQNVRGLVLKRASVVSAVGLTSGIFAAIALNQLLRAMLFETTPADPLVLTTVAVILLAVTTIASLIPAWTTTRIDPVIALKADV